MVRPKKEPADAPAEESEPAFTPRKIPQAQVLEIVAQGQRFSHRIDFLIRKEEQLVKKLTKVREDRKSATRELTALFGDAKSGQGRLALASDDEGDGDVPEPAAANGKALTPGHADAVSYVHAYGERSLRVETFEPGAWVGSVDGAPYCSARSAREAIDGLCDALHLAKNSDRRDPEAWTPGSPTAASPVAEHVAFYKGHRLRVLDRGDGFWDAEQKTGSGAGFTKPKLEGEGAAKEEALRMAGYDTKDPRPTWCRFSRPTPGAVAAAGAAHRRVAEGIPAMIERAAINGHRLDVWVDSSGKARATVDGNFGGEHGTLSKAKAWAIERATGKKIKKGQDLGTWEVLRGKDAFPDAEGLNVIYSLNHGGKYAEVRQSSPGRWDGKVDGSPIAVGLQRIDALKGCERHLGIKTSDDKPWNRSEDFLDDVPAEGKRTTP